VRYPLLLISLCLANIAFAQTPTPTPAPRIFVDGESDFLNAGAFLFCSAVDDDGLPHALTFFWSKVSGPGTLTWTAQQKAITHVRFSAKGLYVIQCAVSDGQYTVTDKIRILADAEADIAVRP
jgi:hypothetical protein